MKQILLISILSIMSLMTQAQDWIDTTMYPFKNHYIELEAGKMHYADQGEGKTILFVHGTPAWSFLYRNYIDSLSKNYRCIAIDHIGFGLSDKPESFDGTPQSHSKNLSEFIEKLNLTDITIVVHDFGGPIGLSAAIQNNDKIKQVILFNTWLWETKSNTNAKRIDKLLNGRMGEFLYLNMNFSPKVLFKKGIYDKKKLTKQVHKQYIYPFPNKSSRRSLLKIGKSLVGSSDWYQEQWNQLNKLESKPWLVLWGTKDEFITPEYLEKWQRRLLNSKVIKYDCGHFVQEEKPMETIEAIKSFLEKNK